MGQYLRNELAHECFKVSASVIAGGLNEIEHNGTLPPGDNVEKQDDEMKQVLKILN